MEKYAIQRSVKSYYYTVFFLIICMFIGISMSNPRSGGTDSGLISHGVNVVVLSIFLLLYPKFRTHSFRLIIVILASTLIYLLFFLYPNTASNLILISLIPTISILLFDEKLFYFSLILNTVLLGFSIIYIYLEDWEAIYPLLTGDIVGSIVNFIGSQVIQCFAFYLTSIRIKNQQVYYEQMKHSERLKTTGELAAAVAHEIRNPLTVVKGYLQMYKQDQSFDTDKREKFTLLIEELNTAEQVISELLSLSKPLKNKETEKINVETSLHSVTDLLQSYGLLNENKINVSVEGTCTITINKMEFHQLLVNIIKNAIEASSSGNPINIFAGRKRSYVEIKVSDVGQGMSAKELELVGTPFYSLKEKGTGLGIMICNQIVANYNGTIKFESNKGHGTTVRICFPYKK
ncbi:HAMP domain-containing histidine kinase [Lysinibacillus sp. BW-2-10]|nr:HAMP domain-containing histidine kinase [Lysinibacillus sp. BW-2-10]